MVYEFALSKQAEFHTLLMTLRDVLWKNIQQHLDESGESLNALALRAKVPQSTLQRFSKGTHRSLSLDHVERIAKALVVSPARLFEQQLVYGDPRVDQMHVAMENLPSYLKDAALATVTALQKSAPGQADPAAPEAGSLKPTSKRKL